MPSSRLVPLALAMAAAGACAAPAATISLTEHRSASIAPSAILTYDSVEDSRCPPDVHCVMAGKVAYSFTLKQGETVEHFTLSPAEPAYTSPALGGKRVTLADTAPPPKAKDAGIAHPVSIRIVAP